MVFHTHLLFLQNQCIEVNYQFLTTNLADGLILCNLF